MSTEERPRSFRRTLLSTLGRGLLPAILSLVVLAIPVILTATPGGLRTCRSLAPSA